MSACDQSSLYTEWRRLTDAETRAIEASDWRHVSQIQAAKARLQTALIEAERRDGPRQPGDSATLRNTLAELIRLEQSNRDRVARLRQIAETNRSALEQSRFNLRRLQERFSNGPQTGWQRYS